MTLTHLHKSRYGETYSHYIIMKIVIKYCIVNNNPDSYGRNRKKYVLVKYMDCLMDLLAYGMIFEVNVTLIF